MKFECALIQIEYVEYLCSKYRDVITIQIRVIGCMLD